MLFLTNRCISKATVTKVNVRFLINSFLVNFNEAPVNFDLSFYVKVFKKSGIHVPKIKHDK